MTPWSGSPGKGRATPAAGLDPTWHDRPAKATLEALQTQPFGLSDSQAAERLQHHGPNRLPEAKRDSPLIRFLRQFNNVLIYVLIAAAATTAALGHFVDTGVILAVVFLNAAIGFFQEGKAERALGAIRAMLAPKATVMRGGQRRHIDGAEVVPGDIVILEAGDRVPADLRLTETRGLKIEEAVLTGESVPAEKIVDPVAAEAPLGDRRSMAFCGTLVAGGQGRGVVVATGAETQIGRISGLIATVQTVTTPLVRQMGVFARWLTAMILGLGALILLTGLVLGSYGFRDLFMAVVGLSVAAIPEGLPAILTVTLAIGVEAMARRQAIVRRLPAIEALGSVTVICSDKTGTLTKNEMTVASVATAARLFTVTGAGYAPHGAIRLEGADIAVADYPLLAEMAKAALLCNDADLREANGSWQILGDPMEGALVSFAAKAGLETEFVRRAHPQTDAIPFDAQHRFMASLHHDHEGQAAIYVKGAPERLLAMCSQQHDGDGAITTLDPDYWHSRAQAITADGQRVLAIAMKQSHSAHRDLLFGDVEDGLTLLGLVGLIDPPRDEAVAAVADCRTAGIRVKMITGDHAGTAAAIARQLGLANTDAVLQGVELDRLSDEELRGRAAAVDVFARTSPEHKLRLVQALQAGGAVVAMTGDGVNDAPALKRADIGIAMGQKGTEAAKEAAEIVLADDNFATIA